MMFNLCDAVSRSQEFDASGRDRFMQVPTGFPVTRAGSFLYRAATLAGMATPKAQPETKATRKRVAVSSAESKRGSAARNQVRPLHETTAGSSSARDRGAPDEQLSAAVLHNLVAVCERDPSELVSHRATASALAAELGGDAAFEWHLCELRAAISDQSLVPVADESARSEWLRERYGELLDRHRADDARISQLRSLGERLRALEEAGVLPSTLVVRTRRPAGRRKP